MAALLPHSFLNVFFLFSTLTLSLPIDKLSLLSFKNYVTHDPSNLLLHWSPTTNHCHWYGVTCHPISSRVISLNLTTTGASPLVGTLPPSIFNLTHLQSLSIPHNSFSGPIPPQIARLRSLRILQLQGNNFSGTIPPHLITRLRLLNLSHNSFSGPLPDALLSGNLTSVDLSNNQLDGDFTIDQTTRCDTLTNLKLSNNRLLHAIPPAIGNCSALNTLLLDGNIFQGKIPPEIGRLSQLVILDVSRNSLNDKIPIELANCTKLSALVLTNLVDLTPPNDNDDDLSSAGEEFNAFEGHLPPELLLIPNLEILWAPRANLGGHFPANWTTSCSLRILNLRENYITGTLPDSLTMCKNLTFLDLSSNNLQGHLPLQLPVRCMLYLNISQNSFSGPLLSYENITCGASIINPNAVSYPNFLLAQNGGIFPVAYSEDGNVWTFEMNRDEFVVAHDFSWNGFDGAMPSFSMRDEFLLSSRKASYQVFVHNNKLNGSLPLELCFDCNDLKSFSLNLTANQISGGIHPQSLLSCSKMSGFEAQGNQIGDSIPPEIDSLKILQRLDLRGNGMSGSLPDQLGSLQDLRWILLGDNNFTGVIPTTLGRLASLLVLDLSQNNLSGPIPVNLSGAKNLTTLLLDHNRFSGEIPSSFLNLSSLTLLDLSFNNLSGHIPHLQNPISCEWFKGNTHLHSCPDDYVALPAELPAQLEVHARVNHSKIRSFVIAMAISASSLLCILAVIILVFVVGRRKLSRLMSLRRNVIVTFGDIPPGLNYENVVRATGNFSIRNLIGTGGFGSTYKAELSPGFLVAVKRLSIGRLQGIQQFNAEIRTLGRIRHEKLVTLIGCYVGDEETFLVYNYLSGGNLETFIHKQSENNVQWPVIHKIALDIAQSLAFLHYSCVPRIVHRDIKPSNILLDEQLNAYLSDFGLARLLEVSQTHATTDVAGTFGYLAPEYATTCRVTEKSDVYSYGVVLLELLSRKKSLDPLFSEYGNGFNIVGWAKMLIREGRASQVFSPELWESGPNEEMVQILRLASACTVEGLSVRPSMMQVVEKLKQLHP